MKKYEYWTTARALGLLFIGIALVFSTANLVLYGSYNRDLHLIGIVLISCGIVCWIFDWITKRGREPTKFGNEE